MPSSDTPPTATAREAEARARVHMDRVACEQSVGATGTQEEYDADSRAFDTALDRYAASIRATEREAAGERVKALESALLKYGTHVGQCNVFAHAACTCGFDRAVSAITNATEGTDAK